MRQLILNIFFLIFIVGCASKDYSIDEIFEDGGEIETTPEDSIKYVCNQKKFSSFVTLEMIKTVFGSFFQRKKLNLLKQKFQMFSQMELLN